jgi:hypothetical protein
VGTSNSWKQLGQATGVVCIRDVKRLSIASKRIFPTAWLNSAYEPLRQPHANESAFPLIAK